MPPWEITVDTRASPPEHIAGEQSDVLGVIVMLFETVPGLTVKVTVTGVVVPVSRAVSVSTVSAVTGFGMTVKELLT
jgi:hypothetical protein